MAFEAREVTGLGYAIVVATGDTFEAVKASVEANYEVAFMEDDADYPGCADVLTVSGRVFAIQPMNFKL